MKISFNNDGSGSDAVTAMIRSEKTPFLVVDDPDLESLFPEIEDDPLLGVHSCRRIFVEVGEIPAYCYFGEPDDDYNEIGFAAEDDDNSDIDVSSKYIFKGNELTNFQIDEKEIAKMVRECERKLYDEQHSKLTANGHDSVEVFDENGYKAGCNPLSMVGYKRFLLQKELSWLQKKGRLSPEIKKKLQDDYDRFLAMTAGPYVRKRFTLEKVKYS